MDSSQNHSVEIEKLRRNEQNMGEVGMGGQGSDPARYHLFDECGSSIRFGGIGEAIEYPPVEFVDPSLSFAGRSDNRLGDTLGGFPEKLTVEQIEGLRWHRGLGPGPTHEVGIGHIKNRQLRNTVVPRNRQDKRLPCTMRETAYNVKPAWRADFRFQIWD